MIVGTGWLEEGNDQQSPMIATTLRSPDILTLGDCPTGCPPRKSMVQKPGRVTGETPGSHRTYPPIWWTWLTICGCGTHENHLICSWPSSHIITNHTIITQSLAIIHHCHGLLCQTDVFAPPGPRPVATTFMVRLWRSRLACAGGHNGGESLWQKPACAKNRKF